MGAGGRAPGGRIPDRRKCEPFARAKMTRSEMIRAGALYFPLMLACIAGLLDGRRPRMLAACLLSLLWTAPALLLLQMLNAKAGWWAFTDGSAWFAGMPLELYIGWWIAWG